MGARPYGARLIEGGASMALPLMILLHDVAYLRRIGSFMAPQAHRYGRPFDPKGRVAARGTAQELLENDEVRKAYFGEGAA